MPITRLLFPTTRMAMRADHILSIRAMKHTVLPVATHLSSECGMSIVIKENTAMALHLLESENITFTAVEE